VIDIGGLRVIVDSVAPRLSVDVELDPQRE
jgi:hypothetical protein